MSSLKHRTICKEYSKVPARSNNETARKSGRKRRKLALTNFVTEFASGGESEDSPCILPSADDEYDSLSSNNGIIWHTISMKRRLNKIFDDLGKKYVL